MKYFSYGMNTNLAQMARRCPKAQSLGKAVLPGFRFEFKQFATVVPDVTKDSFGVVWEITEDCEDALDILEGFPTFYTKQMVTVLIDGIPHTAMTYLMYPDEELFYPSKSYLDMLIEGYEAHNISLDQLNRALDRVHNMVDVMEVLQYNMYMLKRIALVYALVGLFIWGSSQFFKNNIPSEFTVEWIYDGLWSNGKVYIYKTVGNRGQDVFTSSLCQSNHYTPLISQSGNEYTANDHSYDVKLTNGGLTLTITSKDTCLPSGIYQKIKQES